MSERKAFITWVKREHPLLETTAHKDGGFLWATTQDLWTAWQARALAATTAPTEPVAWRWKERDRFFDWTTDWSRHDKAIELGVEIEYAYATPPSAVEAAQPGAVGWKRVPIDPTPDMRDAGGRATRSVYSGVWKEHRKPNEVMCAYIYRAMLAAAPTTEATSSPSDARDAERLEFCDARNVTLRSDGADWNAEVPLIDKPDHAEIFSATSPNAAIDAAILAAKGGKL